MFAKKGGRFFQDGSGKLFSETTIGVSVEKSEIEAALDAVVDGFWLSHLREEPLAVSREGAKLIIQDEIDPVPFGLRERRRGKPYISTAFLWDLAHSLAPQPTVFPAERDSLLLTYKLLHKRRYDLLREQARLINKGETAEVEALGELVALAYPRPIEDFLDMLVEIELQREPEGDPRSPSPFAELADLLEEAIHGNARLRFFPKAAGKDLKLTVKGDLSIDLHNASSSVRQLAPLVLFLRHSANRRSPGLLIIDEPELNLHPESQAKLLEILAIYTTLGGRALLTTHSPYLMAHLQNLISGQIDSPETLRAQASSLYLKDARAFLSPENVSAYEVKDETLRSLRDPEFGFTWDTLSDVSGEIQRNTSRYRTWRLPQPMNKRANRRLSATGGRRGASSDESTHNFLERLLVFCMQSERRAPRESGVRFLVSPPRPIDQSVSFSALISPQGMIPSSLASRRFAPTTLSCTARPTPAYSQSSR